MKVKQSIAYAKAVVEARSNRPAIATKPSLAPSATAPADSVDGSVSTALGLRGSPPTEWRATERRKLTAGLRFLILRRDKFRCQLCGADQADDSGVRLEVDHVVPVAKWGLTVESNLWTLCRVCNGGKSMHQLSQ